MISVDFDRLIDNLIFGFSDKTGHKVNRISDKMNLKKFGFIKVESIDQMIRLFIFEVVKELPIGKNDMNLKINHFHFENDDLYFCFEWYDAKN